MFKSPARKGILAGTTMLVVPSPTQKMLRQTVIPKRNILSWVDYGIIIVRDLIEARYSLRGLAAAYPLL